MKCNKCNHKNKDKAKFCISCGNKLEKVQFQTHSKNKFLPLYIIGGVVILTLLILIFLTQINKQNELKYQLNKFQEDQNFCNNLRISIEKSDISNYIPGAVANLGVNYCLKSNSDTPAKLIVRLKGGKIFDKDQNLMANSCVVGQIDNVQGYQGSGIHYGSINCEDVESIELISTRCPQTKDLVTNMNRITCGV